MQYYCIYFQVDMSNNSCHTPSVNWKQIGNISNTNQLNNVQFDYINANNLSIRNNFFIGNLTVTNITKSNITSKIYGGDSIL